MHSCNSWASSNRKLAGAGKDFERPTVPAMKQAAEDADSPATV